MPRDWRALPERGTAFWLHVIVWIALRIGRPFARLLLYPVTLYFFATARSTRRHSKRFLSIVLGRPARLRDSYRHHRYFACTILDRVYLLSGNHSCLDIRVYGKEPILELISAGSTCMLLGSHLGSFDLLRALGAASDSFSIRAVMEDERTPTMARILDRLNPDAANVVIPLNRPESMLLVREAVEQGHLIGMLGDRAPACGKAHACRFLGRVARFPTGPLKLAAILRLPVFLVFGLYRGANRYEIVFERLSEAAGADAHGGEERIVAQVERFAARLEHFARQSPYNWFNFYDFWQAE